MLLIGSNPAPKLILATKTKSMVVLKGEEFAHLEALAITGIEFAV